MMAESQSRYRELLVSLIRKLLKQHPSMTREELDRAFKQARGAAGGYARAEKHKGDEPEQVAAAAGDDRVTSLASGNETDDDSYEELIEEVQDAVQQTFGASCWTVATFDNAVIYYVGNPVPGMGGRPDQASWDSDSDDDDDESIDPWDDAWEEATEDDPDGDNDADDVNEFYKVEYSRQADGTIVFGARSSVEKNKTFDAEPGNNANMPYEQRIDQMEDALGDAYGDRVEIVATYADRVIYQLDGDDGTFWQQDYKAGDDGPELGDKSQVYMNVSWDDVSAEDVQLVYAKSGASGSVAGGKVKLPKNVAALPPAKQRQWVDVFNKAYKNCGSGPKCEKVAFQFANGVLKREKVNGTTVKGQDGITTFDGEVIHLTQFSDKPWNGAASKYASTDDYCKSCLIDMNKPGEDKVQSLCKLPYREPGGAVNKAALRTIASVLGGGRGGVKGVPDNVLAAAKKKHASLMKQAGIGDDDVKASLDRQLAADTGDGSENAAAMAQKGHGPLTVTHTHEHADYGQDDGDDDGSHNHVHTHRGDNNHEPDDGAKTADHKHDNARMLPKSVSRTNTTKPKAIDSVGDDDSGKPGAAANNVTAEQFVLDNGRQTRPLPRRLAAIDWSERAFAPVALRLADEDRPLPVWQQLHKIGKWVIPHASGQKIQLSREMGNSLIQNFKRRVVRRGVPLDERHFTDSGGHALAWLEEMRWGSEGQGLPGGPEPDGSGPILYGRWHYNDLGEHKLKNEHYRHISPQYHLNYCDNESGQCYGPTLLAVAATNNPYLRVRDLQGREAPEAVAVLEDGLIGLGVNDMVDNVKLEQMQAELEQVKLQLANERHERHEANVKAYLREQMHAGLPPALAKIAEPILLNSSPDSEAIVCLDDSGAPTHNLHEAMKQFIAAVPKMPLGSGQQQYYLDQADVRPHESDKRTLDDQYVKETSEWLISNAFKGSNIDGILASTAKGDG